jgi:hypothetical protein
VRTDAHCAHLPVGSDGLDRSIAERTNLAATRTGGQLRTCSHSPEECWASWNTVRSLACSRVLVANGSAVPELRP